MSDTDRETSTRSGDAAVACALLDLSRAAQSLGVPWALVGGQALITHGAPRDSPGADAILPPDRIGDVAHKLLDLFEWTPLVHDVEGNR
jgi:hypothetical protein